MERSRASHMSRPCGLWQRKLPFAAGMGSASTTPVLRWWSSSQVGGSSAASAAVAAANGRPWHPPAQSGAVGCCRPVRDRWRRSQRRVELQFKKVKLVYRTARATTLRIGCSKGSTYMIHPGFGFRGCFASHGLRTQDTGCVSSLSSRFHVVLWAPSWCMTCE